MMRTGIFNKEFPLAANGIKEAAHVYYNLSPAELYEQAMARKEAKIAAGGALVTATGQHTGRSAKDKFIVRDANTEDQVWWDNNKAMAPEAFERLYADFIAHTKGRVLFVQDLIGGADAAHALPTRVVTELAWHSLFIRNLLIRPKSEALVEFSAQLTIINLPSFRANPDCHGCRSETVIAIDLTRKLVLIGGTAYAGEIKKSVFTALNYLLPAKGIMPMHCSANRGKDGNVAVFFGLSGTGKTTLSADASRTLIGDDEHGWGPDGVFNFEGGCYAKTVRLSHEAEPEIFAATERFGTVLENVILDENRVPNFNDTTLTENTRCAYPLHFMPNASATGCANHPKNIVMLTADAFGILPPIAKLNPEQAIYYFLSGYTAKVAGTENGVSEPEATFSTCFGAPFMPRHPSHYSDLLRKLISAYKVNCWLVNTGWTGGAYGVGERMPLKTTRALLSAALDGTLINAKFRTDGNFGFQVPEKVFGVDSQILNPRATWRDKAAYDTQARKLVGLFVENFAKFENHVDATVVNAAPHWLKVA